MPKITVVPLGICHLAWNDTYYPDDLPDSWKLAYFANDFATACLTAQDLDIMASDARDFADDLPDGFRCAVYLEGQSLSRLPEVLPERIDTVFVAGDIQPSCAHQLTKNYGRKLGIYSLVSGSLPLCHTFAVDAQLHCHLISAAKARDLNGLKPEIAKWLQSDADEIFVIVDSGTDIDLYRNVNILVSLLT